MAQQSLKRKTPSWANPAAAGASSSPTPSIQRQASSPTFASESGGGNHGSPRPHLNGVKSEYGVTRPLPDWKRSKLGGFRFRYKEDRNEAKRIHGMCINDILSNLYRGE